jgi:hypothetical protein
LVRYGRKLDAARAMVLNIDVDGENVPSTLTMTGREYHPIRNEKAAAGTAFGAALLWRRFTRTLPVSSAVHEAVTALGKAGFDRPGLSAAYRSWIGLSEQAP